MRQLLSSTKKRAPTLVTTFQFTAKAAAEVAEALKSTSSSHNKQGPVSSLLSKSSRVPPTPP